MPSSTVQDAVRHVKQAAENLGSALTLLRGARDELVIASIILGRLRGPSTRRSTLLPLLLMGMISTALDVLMPLSARLGTLSTASPAKVEAEWKDVIAALFGE